MNDWRKSPTVALLGIALFATVQLAVPLSRIAFDAGPRRFGWQMYASVQPSPEFTVHTLSGSETIDLDDFMARVRLDLPLEELMPPHLCEVTPGAESITWVDSVFEC